jgi:hypothetical protein
VPKASMFGKKDFVIITDHAIYKYYPKCPSYPNSEIKIDFFMQTKSMLRSLPVKHLKDITNNFCDERILGRGGFGVVYKVKLK